MYSIGMPTSLRAQSGKNGISVPSATLAKKNRNEATRAARGALRNAVNEDVSKLKIRVTSKLQAPFGVPRIVGAGFGRARWLT